MCTVGDSNSYLRVLKRKCCPGVLPLSPTDIRYPSKIVNTVLACLISSFHQRTPVGRLTRSAVRLLSRTCFGSIAFAFVTPSITQKPYLKVSDAFLKDFNNGATRSVTHEMETRGGIEPALPRICNPGPNRSDFASISGGLFYSENAQKSHAHVCHFP